MLIAEALCKQVTTANGRLSILHEVNLELDKGDSAAVKGVSGSGKSTLLGLLAGLDRPSSGRVLLDGVELGALDESGRDRLRAGRVGFVFQSFQLLPTFTALENVMLPLSLVNDPEAPERAREELRRVGLEQRTKHYPPQLSGGEQQRVALARAFVTAPRMLFADEPTGNLDRTSARRIAELLLELNATHGSTLLIATHDSDLAKCCKRQMHLEAGRLTPE